MASTADELSKLNIIGDWASIAPNLQKNLSLLFPQQVELAKVLVEMGQTHLFQHWSEPGVDDDDDKRAFFDQENSFILVASVSTTNKGNAIVAARCTFTVFAVAHIVPHNTALSGRVPESLPSNSCAVLMYTPKSAPFCIILASQTWCLGNPPLGESFAYSRNQAGMEDFSNHGPDISYDGND
ncbi:hypothetical protein FXO37_13071 [Capsicum annuum]|nr:hypothetical protein FXO37_13071 [Capsicum annuum]